MNTMQWSNDVRISLRMWDAGLDAVDLLSAETSHGPPMLGPGETRAHRAFELRDWSTCGGFPRSS
jgi:hypothetical protein